MGRPAKVYVRQRRSNDGAVASPQVESGGFLEFDFGGVAEGIEDARGIGGVMRRPFQKPNGQRMTPPIRPAWWELGKGRGKLETRRQKVESRR